MSNMCVFQLDVSDRDEANKCIDSLNKRLSDAGLRDRFVSERANQEWLDDINNNPASPQAHLKRNNNDKPLTMEQLQQIFPLWTTVGRLECDMAYGRTGDAQCVAIAAILADEPRLAAISGAWDEFKENLSPEQAEKLDKLYRKPEEPKLNKNRRERLQSGLATFKDWNDNDICVVFGNVGSPRFMKDDKFEDDVYNELYKDKLGRPYMLVPLIQLGNGIDQQLNKIIKDAQEIGFCGHPLAFVAAVYGARYINNVQRSRWNEIAGEWSEMECIHVLRRAQEMVASYKPIDLTLVSRDLTDDNENVEMIAIALLCLSIQHKWFDISDSAAQHNLLSALNHDTPEMVYERFLTNKSSRNRPKG